ncbi:copper chaperone PCu(A)C [Halomonadaceae bacterium KBTZ08]
MSTCFSSRRPRAYTKGALLLMAWLAVIPVSADTGQLRVERAWSRATPPGIERGAGYMTLHNGGDQARTLVGAHADWAQQIQIHESRESDGQMQMQAVNNGLRLAPGETVELAPMGLHLMLMGLDGPLTEGNQRALTLEFANGETLDTQLEVRPPGANAGQHNH